MALPDGYMDEHFHMTNEEDQVSAAIPLVNDEEHRPLTRDDSAMSSLSVAPGYQQSGPDYAQVSTRSDEDAVEIEENAQLDSCELDPLKYPPAPKGYYRRDHSTRVTHYGKLIFVLVAIGTACLGIAAVIDVSSPSNAFEPGRDKQSVADSVLASMDRSADPCENFYEYSCGSWLRTTNIPLDRTRYSRSFSSIYDMIELMVKELLEGDLQHTDIPAQSKAGSFYVSCIDQMGIGGLNTLYLSSFRDDFKSLNDARSFSNILARLHTRGSSALFEKNVDVDVKSPENYGLYLSQGGLGLPHRDNYFSMKDVDVNMRRMYVKLIAKLLVTAGKARLIPRQGHDVLARDVLDFETTLANVTLPPEDLRDPEKSYNKVSIHSLSPSFHMADYLKTLGVETSIINSSLILDNVVFFDKLALIMEKLNSDVELRRVVRAYLAFHLVRSAAAKGLLGEDMYHENFKFKQLVYGIKQLPDQWKFCQTLTNHHLGEAVGAAFVKKHFPEDRKEFAKSLSSEIAASFAETLKGEDWMDDPTRAAALDKLGGIIWKVGYSEKLDTYDDVVVSRASYQTNVASALAHKWKKEVGRLGKPIDRKEWFMLPHEVNAYYSPALNEMVFPAGIFQQPFFSDVYPDAMNYGAIGAVVGHEMSHGFDDQGRKYDKSGLLTSWWSEASAAKYEEREKCYVDLYDTYKPRDLDIHVRGNLTLGENIADTNGVNVAYRAFKRRANNTEDGIPPPNSLLARELTNDQLFFVSYAQTWCTLYRQEALKVQMMTDPHSPGQFRVLGPLSQSPIFAKAFSCRNNSRYNPEQKCHLW